MCRIVFAFLLLWLTHVCSDDVVSYRNFKIYTVAEEGLAAPMLRIPNLQGRLSVLSEANEIDKDNKPYTVRTYLVPGAEEAAFRRFLDVSNAEYTVSVDDLGRAIEEEKKSFELGKRGMFGEEDCARSYCSYNEMTDYLKRLALVDNPDTGYPLAEVGPIGRTFEGKTMHLVKISSDHSARKPIIFFEAGIHAREWTAPATAFYIMHQLVHNYTYNAYLLDDIDFYIIPLSNPDGYEYSRNTDRLWRKTRSRHGQYYGVDGNRNFDFYWGGQGTSIDPESNIYIGPRPFSERETKNIRDAGMKYKRRINMFVSIHAYGSYIVYPWSYAKTAPAPQADIMDMVARAAATAIKDYNGTVFKVGNSATLMYAAAGGSDDYFKGVLGVDLSFTVELSSGLGKRGTFITPADRLSGIVEEAFEGFKVMADFASKYRKNA